MFLKPLISILIWIFLVTLNTNLEYLLLKIHLYHHRNKLHFKTFLKIVIIFYNICFTV